MTSFSILVQGLPGRSPTHASNTGARWREEKKQNMSDNAKPIFPADFITSIVQHFLKRGRSRVEWLGRRT